MFDRDVLHAPAVEAAPRLLGSVLSHTTAEGPSPFALPRWRRTSQNRIPDPMRSAGRAGAMP
jgi:hypothetical protein